MAINGLGLNRLRFAPVSARRQLHRITYLGEYLRLSINVVMGINESTSHQHPYDCPDEKIAQNDRCDKSEKTGGY